MKFQDIEREGAFDEFVAKAPSRRSHEKRTRVMSERMKEQVVDDVSSGVEYDL